MTFLATQPIEQRQQQQQLALTPGDPDAFKPGFFQGSGTAAATGLGRVVGIANQLAGEAEYQAGALFTRPVDELFDTKATQFLDEELRQGPAQLTASMTPDPQTTGTLGRILYGVVGVGVPTAVGGYLGGPVGAAALGGTFQSVGTYTDLTQQGVDPNTATGAALFEGTMTAIGVGLPGSIGGRAALSTLLYGPGINIAQDVVTGQGTAAWLESRGYTELADRYATIDAEMIAADIVLGAGFGYLSTRAARVPRGTVATGDVDAALTAMSQRHVEVDTAPGIPANYAAVQSHTHNLQVATEALLDGRAVEAQSLVGEFVPKPDNAAYSDDALLQAFRESGLPGLLDDVAGLEAELARRGRTLDDEPLPAMPAAIPRDGKLTGLDAAIEDRLARQITADLPGAIDRYGRLTESEGGKVLNTDVARELSADYQADRTRSAAVHEPASWLVKEMYRRKLREAPRAGEEPLVLFTGGGTGAGKTSAIEGIPSMRQIKATAQMIYDTNLNGLASSVTKIEQALKADKAVRIAFVVRDPVEALVKGALPRAERMGRTVPLAEHAKTHIGAAETLQKLAEKYADHPKVDFVVIDNTRGKGKAQPADIAFIATMDYSDLTKRLRAALDQEYERGTISEAVYRGTAGIDAASAGLRRAADAAEGRAGPAAARAVRDELQGARPADDRGNGAQPELQDGEQAGLTAAADALADTPKLSIVDETGQPVPAAAMMADADRAIMQAEQDAPGYLAAINCFTRYGA